MLDGEQKVYNQTTLSCANRDFCLRRPARLGGRGPVVREARPGEALLAAGQERRRVVEELQRAPAEDAPHLDTRRRFFAR